MKFFKHLSDDELIERHRKNLRLSKRLAWVHLFFATASWFLISKFFQFFSGTMEGMPENSQKLAYSGLLIGLVFGLMISAYFLQAVRSILRGFNLSDENRSIELLVKYHDLLKTVAEQENDKQANAE